MENEDTKKVSFSHFWNNDGRIKEEASKLIKLTDQNSKSSIYLNLVPG